MAAAAGSSYGAWQAYEGGKKTPGSQVIAGMVAQGINANWLLTGEGPMTLKELEGQRFDVKTLEQAVNVAETRLKLTSGTLPIEAKAKFVADIYQLLIDEGGSEGSRAELILKLLSRGL